MRGIAVAITTHNRPESRSRCLDEWRRHVASGTPLILVDDASETPAAGADFRFEENVGVATAKNKCLELLMQSGAEHLFLADDDCWPAVDAWWQPYVEAEVPHLMYLMRLEKKLIWSDGRVWAAPRPRGVLLYAHRSTVEKVGGMRTEFPRWGNEHTEWSRRIHETGLTPYPYMDVARSAGLWVALDHYRKIPSTASIEERVASLQLRQELMAKFDGSTDFVEYR